MNADLNPEAVEEVTNPVADPVETPPEPVVEVAAAVDDTPWFAGARKLVDSAFVSEVDPKAYTEMLAKMTPEDIANMPPGAVATMRAVVELERHGRSEFDRAKAEFAEASKKEREAIAADRKAQQQESAQLAALLTSPEVRKLRETKVPEKPDLTTPAGQRLYFDALVGKKIEETFGGVLDRAEKVSVQAKWQKTVETFPELASDRLVPELGGKTFLAAVEEELTLREKQGRNPDTADVSMIVRGQIAAAQTAARIASDRARRAQAATNIQRPVAGGGGPQKKTVPAHILKSGLAQWMRENPDYRPE